MKLIVGLGNPGPEYVGTRHNIGFDVVDMLALRLGWTYGNDGFNRFAKTKFDGLAMDGTYNVPTGQTEKLLLLKPMTFMNLSGRCVQQAMAFYQVEPSDIMVVLDDIALPCGKIRLRPQGSDGGHNGLKDIQRALSTNRYPRLRMGIDAPPQFVPQKDYVLGKFTEQQKQSLKSAMDRAASAIFCWIESGIEPAMTKFNADEKPDDAQSRSSSGK
jgi:PTH1 family peptidyl-tRNA hydrolase